MDSNVLLNKNCIPVLKKFVNKSAEILSVIFGEYKDIGIGRLETGKLFSKAIKRLLKGKKRQISSF